MDHETQQKCSECIALKETFKRTTLELGQHAERHVGVIKDIAYIKREEALFAANNSARRAFLDHRDKEHSGVVYA